MTDEQKKACRTVERMARMVGKDCQVIFTADGVSVAPLEWPGEAFGETFEAALEQALSSER